MFTSRFLNHRYSCRWVALLDTLIKEDFSFLDGYLQWLSGIWRTWRMRRGSTWPLKRIPSSLLLESHFWCWCLTDEAWHQEAFVVITRWRRFKKRKMSLWHSTLNLNEALLFAGQENWIHSWSKSDQQSELLLSEYSYFGGFDIFSQIWHSPRSPMLSPTAAWLFASLLLCICPPQPPHHHF